MKKIFLVLVMTTLVSSAWAQSQLTTVRGKTKDGKTIKVEYYQGNVEDYVESVKYQLVDELQARVTELQGKLDAANRQVRELKARNQGGDKENQINELYGQIDVLNDNIRKLNRQLTEKNISYDSLVTVNQGLQEQIANANNVKPVAVNPNGNEKELKRLRDSIVSKDATISRLHNSLADCERQMDQLEKRLQTMSASSNQSGPSQPAAPAKPTAPVKSPAIGVELGIGPAFTRDELEEGWASELGWAKKIDVYFGTARLSDGFPISIEAGVGLRNLKLSANGSACEQTVAATDVDGDSYQAIYTYGARTENLSLTYLDIPVRVCFGQPAKNFVSVYAKVGLTPSILMNASFEGTGTYSLKGYYPQWDVTLEDISELGFGSGMECYDGVEPEMNSFVLWGNLAVGAYVPFGNAPVLLNAGIGLDMPFMTLGTASETIQVLSNGGKVVIPSVEIGLVYTLK